MFLGHQHPAEVEAAAAGLRHRPGYVRLRPSRTDEVIELSEILEPPAIEAA